MTLKLIPPGQRKGNKNFLALGHHKGRYIERSLRTADPGEAETRFQRLQLELSGQAPKTAIFTFSDAAALYLAFRQPSKPWRRAIKGLESVIGFQPAASLKTDDLVMAAAKLYPRAKNETRNRMVIGPAAAVLHHATDNGRIPKVRFKKFKERAGPPKAVSREAAQAIIGAASGMQRAFLIFLFKHGWRIGEALRLQWGDIDIKERVVRRHIRKTNEWQILPLQGDVQEALEAEVPRERRIGRVFSWGDKSNVYRWLKPLCEGLGVRFTPHMARHSFATWLVNDGATPLDVMEAGGWRDVKSVMRYGRVSRERVRALLDRERMAPREPEIIRHAPARDVRDDPAS